MTACYSWIILTLAVVDYGSEYGRIGWAPDYPRAGTDRGAIEVKGTARANKPWHHEGKVVLEVWKNDSAGSSFEVEVKNGVWGPVSIRGLVSTEAYNLVVCLPLRNGKSTITIASDPRRATAR